MKVLFICRGNVGRSQMAEAIFKKIAHENQGEYEVSSAGTIVKDKEGVSQDGQKLGDLSGAEVVIEALAEIGIEGKDFVRTQLTKQMVEEADEIVVMAESYSIPDYLAQSPKVSYWEIEDPKGQNLAFTRDIRNQIEEKVTAFYKLLG